MGSSLIGVTQPCGVKITQTLGQRVEKEVFRAGAMFEETNRKKKWQNGLKGKELGVLEHLGQLHRPATSAPGRQGLAHLGSSDESLPRSGSHTVFLSILEKSLPFLSTL